MSKLAKLQDKFEHSGFKGYAKITDGELIELRDGLKNIVDYFYNKNEHTISSGVRCKLTQVENMINARNYS